MIFWLKLYLLTLPVFAAVDLLWIGVLARDLYKENLGHLLSPTVNWTAAAVFYLLYIGGILLFAVRPGLEEGSVARAALWGALFGFFTYMTYELTNAATLPNWPLKVIVLDTLWGVVLCATVAAASARIGIWLRA
ncbi:MAG TPA: DUF2177 family protein [Gemmatimonadales bacterium]|nr:DUF2177 family protein [Gemmatimonadales bacterium]